MCDDLPEEVWDVYNPKSFKRSKELKKYCNELIKNGISENWIEIVINYWWNNLS